jgi:hypothetical protein
MTAETFKIVSPEQQKTIHSLLRNSYGENGWVKGFTERNEGTRSAITSSKVRDPMRLSHEDIASGNIPEHFVFLGGGCAATRKHGLKLPGNIRKGIAKRLSEKNIPSIDPELKQGVEWFPDLHGLAEEKAIELAEIGYYGLNDMSLNGQTAVEIIRHLNNPNKPLIIQGLFQDFNPQGLDTQRGRIAHGIELERTVNNLISNIYKELKTRNPNPITPTNGSSPTNTRTTNQKWWEFGDPSTDQDIAEEIRDIIDLFPKTIIIDSQAKPLYWYINLLYKVVKGQESSIIFIGREEGTPPKVTIDPKLYTTTDNTQASRDNIQIFKDVYTFAGNNLREALREVVLLQRNNQNLYIVENDEETVNTIVEIFNNKPKIIYRDPQSLTTLVPLISGTRR